MQTQMIRKKHVPMPNDFRTGFFSRLFFVVAFILLLLVLCIASIGIFFSSVTIGIIGFIVGLYHSSILDTLLAFLIITIGIGGILYFFNRQFAKLDEIAKELNEETDTQNEEE